MQWLKKDRCKKCTEERSVRYCLRHNKELGWSCCNSYRADGKCPEACPYFPKKDTANSLLPQVKSDSRTEFLDYLERYLQFWIYLPFDELDNKAPYDLIQSTEGKAKLTDWLSKFNYVDSSILSLLNKKLQLELAIPVEHKFNTEDLAAEYLDAIIAHDWDKAATFHIHNTEASAETTEYIVKQLMNHPLLKKVRTWSIINSGFTQDLKQAFVFCELNQKENWTFIFVNNDNTWQFYQSIWGTLQDYYDQKTQFRQIAVAINQKNDHVLFNLLNDNINKYPLSADIQYYYGLAWGMTDRINDAKVALLNAIMLEPNWLEPLYQLAFLYMNQKDFDTAISCWSKLALHNPQDANIQNNIGVCYLGLGQTDQAKTVWETALLLDPDSEMVKKNLEHLNNE